MARWAVVVDMFQRSFGAIAPPIVAPLTFAVLTLAVLALANLDRGDPGPSRRPHPARRLLNVE